MKATEKLPEYINRHTKYRKLWYEKKKKKIC